MKNHALIIKNITYEKPGLISELLEKYDIEYSIVDLSKKLEFPNIKHTNLIIIMGGPDSANDETEKILKELELIKNAFKEEIPIFGVCLGLQLMVKAFGGEVYPNSIEEVGFKHNNTWYKIELTREGIDDPVFKGINNNFIVFQLHSETIRPINGIKVLGTGELCKNQIIKIGEYNYGFQFHFEITEDLFKLLLNKAPELRGKDLNVMLNDFNIVKNQYIERGTKIFQNYLHILNFI